MLLAVKKSSSFTNGRDVLHGRLTDARMESWLTGASDSQGKVRRRESCWVGFAEPVLSQSLERAAVKCLKRARWWCARPIRAPDGTTKPVLRLVYAPMSRILRGDFVVRLTCRAADQASHV